MHITDKDGFLVEVRPTDITKQKPATSSLRRDFLGTLMSILTLSSSQESNNNIPKSSGGVHGIFR